MAINPINNNQYGHKHIAKHTGTAAGLALSSAYIIKNRKDLFINGGKKAAEALGYSNKAVGIAIPVAVGAAIVGATTLLGTLIGAGIDKIKNNIIEKKAAHMFKAAIAQNIEKQLKEKDMKAVNIYDIAAQEGIELD